jgi:hypothetical protein
MNETGKDGYISSETVPPMDAVRSELGALRDKYGAHSPVGHACSNIRESMEVYQKSRSAEQRLWLVGRIGQETKRLAGLLAAMEIIPLKSLSQSSQPHCNSR